MVLFLAILHNSDETVTIMKQVIKSYNNETNNKKVYLSVKLIENLVYTF